MVNCGKGEGTHVPAQRAGKFFFRGTGLPTAVRKNQPLVPRSNLGGKVCTRTDPWFRGQTLPVLGHGGMIGGGGCRIKYVMWMDGLLRLCVVCLAAVNTATMNTRLYPSGHFRLPTTCSCQLIVSAVSTDTVFSVGRCSARAATAQYLDEDVHIVLCIFFQT